MLSCSVAPLFSLVFVVPLTPSKKKRPSPQSVPLFFPGSLKNWSLHDPAKMGSMTPTTLGDDPPFFQGHAKNSRYCVSIQFSQGEPMFQAGQRLEVRRLQASSAALPRLRLARGAGERFGLRPGAAAGGERQLRRPGAALGFGRPAAGGASALDLPGMRCAYVNFGGLYGWVF